MPSTLAISILLLVGAANIALDVVLVGQVRQSAASRPPPLSHYSFVGDDYPPDLPLPSARPSVRLALEESVRYSLSTVKQPESDQEWLYMGAVGDTNVRLGPNHRFFQSAFSYEIHCTGIIVSSFEAEPPTSTRDREHLTRCLNVMRRAAMCDADATLEPADSFGRNYTAIRLAGEHRCTDWPALYETMKGNWLSWRRFSENAPL